LVLIRIRISKGYFNLSIIFIKILKVYYER